MPVRSAAPVVMTVPLVKVSAARSELSMALKADLNPELGVISSISIQRSFCKIIFKSIKTFL